MLIPIETEYNGWRFRSRLEARWAVYFEAVGLKWEYEFQGFERQVYNLRKRAEKTGQLDYWRPWSLLLAMEEGTDPEKARYLLTLHGVEKGPLYRIVADWAWLIHSVCPELKSTKVLELARQYTDAYVADDSGAIFQLDTILKSGQWGELRYVKPGEPDVIGPRRSRSKS